MRPTVPHLRHGIAIVLVAAALPLLAACGDDDDDGAATSGGATETTERGGGATGGAETTERGGGATGGPETTERGGGAGRATELTIDATESGDRLGWSRRQLTARAGTITIRMDNPSSNQLPHAVAIEGGAATAVSETVEPGREATATADLSPGTYVFYCPVGDHRGLGMVGTLTVR